MKSYLVCLCLAVVAVVAEEKEACTSTGAADIRPDPYDCSVFYMCTNNKLVRFTCPKGTVFNPAIKVCVFKGSIWDKCTIKTKAKISTCTPGSTAVIPHATKCAQYYDCGDNTKVWRWPLHLKECPYEQLFNVDTKKCEHYSMVKCGQRDEPIDFCDYELNLCRTSHCIPCYVHHPSCKNLPDGLNARQGREESPYYVICKNNRTVYLGMCEQKNGTYLFDAKQRTCVKYVE